MHNNIFTVSLLEPTSTMAVLAITAFTVDIIMKITHLSHCVTTLIGTTTTRYHSLDPSSMMGSTISSCFNVQQSEDHIILWPLKLGAANSEFKVRDEKWILFALLK